MPHGAWIRDAAIARLKEIPVSIHCWQGDDVTGLENAGEALSGGIQTTGNYPGKARTFEELTADFDKACSLIPGKKRLNLHASYAVMTDANRADRDELRPEHFASHGWIMRKSAGSGWISIPRSFSHPMVKDGLTLSSPDENVRRFWIRHGIACRRIAAYFAKELNTHCLCNVWIPDGLKDVPADRLSPRLRLKDSLDQIFAEKLPGVIDSVESKVFGIGLEAYTVGSNGILHRLRRPATRRVQPVGQRPLSPAGICQRQNSRHAVLFRQAAAARHPAHALGQRPRGRASRMNCGRSPTEIVRCNATERVLIGLDFFDASINRVAAWVIGARNMEKALLWALLMPHDRAENFAGRGPTSPSF